MIKILLAIFMVTGGSSSIYMLPRIPSTDICPDIITRMKWGARAPLEIEPILTPVENVIVHHTVTEACMTGEKCAELVKKIQNYHLENKEFHDIGYNFLVGGDGSVYEGAGWHIKGTHTKDYNSRSLGLAFIGTFNDALPNEKQLQAAKMFLLCGVELGELSKDFKLFGARQVRSTDSPGLKLYHELKHWDHFTSTPPKQ